MLRYAITDRRLFPGDEKDRFDALLAQAGRLASEGVDFLQIRERDLPEREMEALALALVEAVRDRGTTRPRVLLNGPAHTAIAAGADGVHLRGGARAGDLEAVQQAFGMAGRTAPIVSVSCHTVEEARSAGLAGFDLLLFGPVFEKRVGGEVVAPGLGLQHLREASRSGLGSRLLALGGLTRENSLQCGDAGADGVAGIRMFLQAG